MKCRCCAGPLTHMFLDLGTAPPSNAYLAPEDLEKPELYLPLRLYVCDQCWLVQTWDTVSAETFFAPDYAYFSSVSQSWLAHAAEYSRDITQRLDLGQDSFVMELASNDGYLLQNFVAAGVPCLGVEPTDSTADLAEARGVPTLRRFFGETLGAELAATGRTADLIIGNNVFAHVPDINDFTRGLKACLKPGGTITLEFPHLFRLIEGAQFDTVYHEHFSYLSLQVTARIFAAAGLRVVDVEELGTHGGSLRVYGAHADDTRTPSAAVAQVLEAERALGLETLAPYQDFQAVAEGIKDGLLHFLLDQKRRGQRVAAYGAAAKGNTLLNFAGIRQDLVRFVCDAAPAKQGKFLPGSRLPVLTPAALRQDDVDTVLILPWNIAPEIRAQMAHLDVRFVAAIPQISDL